MEADPGKQRSRQKRRDRPLQLQQEKQTREEDEGSGHDDHEDSLPRSSKDKMSRSKPKKGKSALFEEDIIDGFAIMSFTTLEELENVAKKNGCVQTKVRAEEDISIKDTNAPDKDSNTTKKKKIKKTSPLNHFTGNCVDSNDNASDSNNSCALSSNSDSVGVNGNNNNSSEVDANSNSSLVASIITRDHQLGHQHLCHRQQNNSDQTDAQVPSSRDKLCDVFGLEKGDDKTPESVSDRIAVGGILNHLNNNGRNNPCAALSAPTPPPSTSTTPTTLCNGIGGSTNPFHSAVHQVLVATTTTTTHTTTTSISRPNFTDSLTTSTVTAVTTAALPSQPVINSSPYHPEQQGLKPSQLPPGSSLSHSNSQRTLSPNTSQNHDSSNLVSDNSSCARSLQYSRVHKSNHIQYKPKEPPQHHSPTSSNNQHHHHHLQHHTSDNPVPAHLQNGPSNLNCQDSSQSQGPANSCPAHDHAPGFTHPNPPLIRPDPLVHNSSPHVGINSRADPVVCSSGGSAVTNNVVTAASPVATSTSTSHGHGSQEHQHHGSNHHRSSSSSSKSHHGPHQNHKHSSRDRPASPCGHPGKRVCRTPPVGLHPAVAGPALNSAPVVLNDASRHSTTPVSPRCPSGKFESIVVSTAGRNERDHFDRLKPKEGSISAVIGSNHHHHHHHHQPHSQHHHSKDHRDRDRDRDKEREKVSASQGIPLHPASNAFPPPKPAWSSAPGPLYSSLIQSHHHHSPLPPSSSLHSLSSHSSSSVTSHASPHLPLPLAPPPPLLAAGAPTLSAGMFAPPLHPAPPSLSSASPHPHVSGQFSAESLLRGQDFLHQDLNNRLLAHHDSSSIALPPSPFVRSETHQHQHQHLHNHNHMHQHTYGGHGLGGGSLLPPSSPLFDKIPKAYEAGVYRPSFDKIPKALEASVFRPNIVPSYSAAFASLLPPGPSGTSLASSLQGAFQPKNLVTPGQMLVSYRDREKAVAPPGLPPLQKKQSRWCAVHVRVAWEIYHRQHKKLQKDADGTPGSSSSSSKSGPDIKPLEPLLRPASHLLPGGGGSARSSDSSLLSSVNRGLPDGMNHSNSSLLSSAAQLGLSPFPRPSPYPPPSLLNPLGFSGLGSSMFAPVHEMPPPGLSSSAHEWNRLHRTPSSFPSWPKSEAERDKDREKERERELRREEEKDRRGSINHHHLSGLEDTRHGDSRPKSRSRSRSPLVNGRIDHHKSDLGSYDKRPLSASSSGLKVKEERREEDLSLLPHHLAEREKRERDRLEREKLERDRLERDRMERDRMERERIEKEKLFQNAAAVAEREKLIQAVEQREKFLQTSGYFGSFGAGLPTHPGLLDRRVAFMGHPGTTYPFLDRPPVPVSMWSPFDKSAEIAHRLDMERERERLAMMSRLSSIPSQLAALEQERLKEQILREQQQEREYDIRRQYLDRLPSFNADRLRAVDPLALGGYFPRTLSPMFGPGSLAGLKSNSPHGIPVAPPPLIHSSSTVAATMLSRSHDNSPSSSSKSKGCSPADSTSDLKDKRDGSSTDPDAHLR